MVNSFISMWFLELNSYTRNYKGNLWKKGLQDGTAQCTTSVQSPIQQSTPMYITHFGYVWHYVCTLLISAHFRKGTFLETWAEVWRWAIVNIKNTYESSFFTIVHFHTLVQFSRIIFFFLIWVLVGRVGINWKTYPKLSRLFMTLKVSLPFQIEKLGQ